MYKDSKWAKEIISLQKEEGQWGYFHTLSEPKKFSITTEQALRRLEILGYTIEDSCIQKAVEYMHDCLIGKKEIPDRREKVLDWDVFSQLMLSTWIKRFTGEDEKANQVARTWADIITYTFRSGVFSYEDYVYAYNQHFPKLKKGARYIDITCFYVVSVIADCLKMAVENTVFDYLLNHETGIYYIYGEPICNLPEVFESKKASRYLGGVELLSVYHNNLSKLTFVTEWLSKQKNEEGKWDMGSSVKDFVYFPLSDVWKKEDRIKDCTYRIEKLINRINSGNDVN